MTDHSIFVTSRKVVRLSRFQIRVYLFYQNWLETCANVKRNVDLCKQMHPCSVVINYFAFLSVTRCSGQNWRAWLLDCYKQRPSSGINASTWLPNQELPVLFWNPICITAFKRPRHWTICWISYIHFTLLHSVSLISVSVLSYLLRLGLPSALYSSGSCDSFCVPFELCMPRPFRTLWLTLKTLVHTFTHFTLLSSFLFVFALISSKLPLQHLVLIRCQRAS